MFYYDTYKRMEGIEIIVELSNHLMHVTRGIKITDNTFIKPTKGYVSTRIYNLYFYTINSPKIKRNVIIEIICM